MTKHQYMALQAVVSGYGLLLLANTSTTQWGVVATLALGGIQILAGCYHHYCALKEFP